MSGALHEATLRFGGGRPGVSRAKAGNTKQANKRWHGLLEGGRAGPAGKGGLGLSGVPGGRVQRQVNRWGTGLVGQGNVHIGAGQQRESVVLAGPPPQAWARRRARRRCGTRTQCRVEENCGALLVPSAGWWWQCAGMGAALAVIVCLLRYCKACLARGQRGCFKPLSNPPGSHRAGSHAKQRLLVGRLDYGAAWVHLALALLRGGSGRAWAAGTGSQARQAREACAGLPPAGCRWPPAPRSTSCTAQQAQRAPSPAHTAWSPAAGQKAAARTGSPPAPARRR